TYVASYFAPVGRYAVNEDYFASAGVTNGPLTALAAGVDGPNGVYAYGVSGTAATIAWTTNEAADSQVEYGPTTAYGSSTTLDTSLVTGHSQALSGLSPGTLHHYRVKSRD